MSEEVVTHRETVAALHVLHDQFPLGAAQINHIREGVKVEKKCDNYRNFGRDAPPTPLIAIILNIFF